MEIIEVENATVEESGRQAALAEALKSSVIAGELKNSAPSFHFSEVRIVRLASDDDFLSLEREMNDLFQQWDPRREDDQLLDQYWGLYSVVAKTNAKGLVGTAAKLRLLLNPYLGMEIGERAEDYISLRQILAAIEHEISRPRPPAERDDIGGHSSPGVIGFGEPDPTSPVVPSA